MGIVAKQSVLNTLYTYIGFLFGAINTLFLFPIILNQTEWGLITYLATSSNLLWPILAFGMHNSLIKFFHSYSSQQKRTRLFSWMLGIPLFFFFGILLIYLLFYNQLEIYYSNSNPIIAKYSWTIPVLGILSAYFELFYAWLKVHLQSVKGNFIKEIFLRVGISLLLIFVHFKTISFPTFVYTLVVVYAFRTLFILAIAYKVSPFTLSFKKLPQAKKIVSYAILILIASIVGTYLLDLDKLMIEYYLPVKKLPSYTIPIFMASVIAVPTRALQQITTPLASKFMNNKQFNDLKSLNYKSSLNGLFISGTIAILIITNTHSLFALVPNNYELYIEILLYISLIKIFDASLGVTNSILINSEAYYWVLFFGVGLLIIAFFLNSYFIPLYGIKGAALASLIAYSLYNSIKLGFIYYIYGIQPYSKKTISIFIFLCLLGGVFFMLNFSSVLPFLSIIIKSTLTISLVLFFNQKLKLSPETNLLLQTFLKKIKRHVTL